jgi:RNA 3'-terminal phosphate cyclase (ATP)
MDSGNSILNVDGAQGEGGGQILRTALALSAIRGAPLEIHSIRARRKTPGLQPQHLAAVTALAEITGARVRGAALGSQRITFEPRSVRPGEYRFAVKTAGSTSLVLQAILFPLALAPGGSRVTIAGGTHVPWSPPADYIRDVLSPALEGMGIRLRLQLHRWGFYPKGGGEIAVEIAGPSPLQPVSLVIRKNQPRIRGVSTVVNLARRIAERQRDRALRRLESEGLAADIAVIEGEGPGPGSFLMLIAETGGFPAGFSALGERGKPAEHVADEAAAGLLEYVKSEAGCDPHLADQLILPMALAPGTSRLTTSRVTRHLLTTVQIAQQLLGCPTQLGGEEGSPGSVTLEGIGWSAERRAPSAERVAGAASQVRETHNSQLGFPIPKSAIRNPKSEMSLVVRKARATDVPAIQTLVAHFAAKGDLLPRTLNDLYQHLRDFFVCELEGDVAGICALSVYWEDLAEIRSLAVKEEHGGRGLGAALATACLDEAANLGVRRVFALTYRPGFFEKLGFRVIDKRELPQKIWKDCIKCAKFACCDEVALIREV